MKEPSVIFFVTSSRRSLHHSRSPFEQPRQNEKRENPQTTRSILSFVVCRFTKKVSIFVQHIKTYSIYLEHGADWRAQKLGCVFFLIFFNAGYERSSRGIGIGMDDPAIYLHSDKRQTGMYLYR